MDQELKNSNSKTRPAGDSGSLVSVSTVTGQCKHWANMAAHSWPQLTVGQVETQARIPEMQHLAIVIENADT